MEIRHKKRSVLSRLSAWVFKIIGNSFIGRFFKSYDKANTKFVKNNVKNAKNRYSPRRKRFERALENIEDAITALDGFTQDIAGECIERAVSALGEIDGRTAALEIVNEIFSHFCVRK